MAYDESRKKAAMKYIKNKQQEIKIRYRNEDYENRIKPAIDKSGLPTATFIKQAVEEKIERDGLVKADETVEETVNAENQLSDQINAEELIKYPNEDIFVIGGEQIYKQLLDQCDVAHIKVKR